MRLGPEQQHQATAAEHLLFTAAGVANGDALQTAVAGGIDHLRPRADPQPRAVADLGGEVLRHRRLQAVAAHEDRHRPREPGEVDGRLSGGVPPTHDDTSVPSISRAADIALP